MSDSEKQKNIVEFYKEWTTLWENIRGDQVNHASADSKCHATITDHRSPYVRILEEALRFAGISVDDPEKFPKKVLDVGCGLGAASRYFAVKYGAKCVGINISPHQVDKANALASAEGSADKVSYQVADAMQQPFADGEFDLVWCMECGEHMTDRTKFVSELARVTAPGGTIILISSCQRNLRSGEKSIGLWEKILLSLICSACYFSTLCSSAYYVNLLESFSLQDIKETTTTDLHAPLWSVSMRSVFSWKGFTSMLCSGLKAIRGAFSMPLLIAGYKTGLLKVALITCRKSD